MFSTFFRDWDGDGTFVLFLLNFFFWFSYFDSYTVKNPMITDLNLPGGVSEMLRRFKEPHTPKRLHTPLGWEQVHSITDHQNSQDKLNFKVIFTFLCVWLIFVKEWNWLIKTNHHIMLPNHHPLRAGCIYTQICLCMWHSQPVQFVLWLVQISWLAFCYSTFDTAHFLLIKNIPGLILSSS